MTSSDNVRKYPNDDVIDPSRPEQGDAVVYAMVSAAAPEEALYVGATSQHPAVRVTMNQRVRAAVVYPRYRILEVCTVADLPRREREWVRNLDPPLNRAPGGSGRGMKADTARIREMYASGLSGRAVAAALGIHHATVMRHIPVADRRERGPSPIGT